MWSPQNSTVVYLRLNQAFSWEIRVIKSANKSKLAAIFIDPPVMEVLDKLTFLEQQHATTRCTNNIDSQQHN